MYSFPKSAGLYFLGGILYALAFPTKMTSGFFPLSILGSIIFLSIFKRHSFRLKLAFVLFLLFSLGFSLMGYHWIPYTLKEFGGITPPFNYALGILFSLIVLPQYLVFVLLYKIIQRIFKILPKGHFNPGVALILTLLECFIPQQFTAHAGHPWLQAAPYLGLAPYFGSPLFSFATFWMALGIIDWYQSKKIDSIGIVFVVLFLAGNFFIPLNPKPDKKDAGTTTTSIRMVQGNIGNLIKVNAETGKVISLKEVYQKFLNLSTLPSSRPIDLIIWPETAIPNLLDSSLVNPSTLPPAVSSVLKKTGASLLSGGYDKANQSKKSLFEGQYNAIFLFNKHGQLQNFYRKHLLIPFGETFPFGRYNKHFADVLKHLSFFASGKKFSLFKLDNDVTFISTICYEILFFNYVRNYLKKIAHPPHFIVNPANDSWYGNSAEPYQHKFLAHWRALEFNLPIVRITNTGISSILYPDGSESKRIGLFQSGILDIELVTQKNTPTWFERFGLWPILLLGIIILTVAAYFSSRKNQMFTPTGNIQT